MGNGRDAKWAPTRIESGLDGTCAVCLRVYAVHVPVGGDGSVRILRRHRRAKRPRGEWYCPGALTLRVEDPPR